MERRKQSVIALSFGTERQTAPQVDTRREHEKEGGRGEEYSKSLMELGKEIAGALLAHQAAGHDLLSAKEKILTGLVETIGCPRGQAHRLVDLALELIHLQAYGKYRRNPLELSLLLRAATGQPEVDASSN